MSQGQVYDPEFGLVSAEDAERINAHRRDAMTRGVSVDTADGGFLGVRGPGADQKLGIDLQPVAQQDAQQIFDAFPQVIGMLAQLVPQLRGAKAAFAVPSAVEAARQWWEGEDIDPIDIGVEGAKGLGVRAVGRGVEKIGEKGVDLVTRALGLGGKSDAAIEALPKIAIKEGASMTKEGANAVRRAGTTRLPGGVIRKDKAYHELADALDEARRKFQTAPSRITFWPNEMAANALRQAPRELKMGQFLAAPFGVDTARVLAPGLQTAAHLKLIQLANAMNDGGEEPSLEGSRGPARRPLR